MATLKQSPMALNVQCVASVRVLHKGPNRPSSYRPLKSSFFRTGIRKFNPFMSKVSEVIGTNRARIVMADSAAESYAKALAELAQSENMLDEVNSDIDKLSKFIADNDFNRFLVNPIIPAQKKKDILKAIANDAKFQTYTLNFLNVLIDKRRIILIRKIVKDFELAYNKLTDTELAVVTSVVKLENRHLAEIAKKIQSFSGAKNVRLKTVIDPSLIAGFTIRFGRTGSGMIDMSVKNELDKLSGQVGYKEILA